jgi:mRNA-degrading endonuclease RelE of RelBE toxin-antitoxin system
MRFDEQYSVNATRDFDKIVRKKLTPQLKKALDQKIKLFSKKLNYPSLNTKKLNVSQRFLKSQNIDEVWEFRINMGFRCIFYVDENEKQIILVFVGNHEDIRKFTK